MRPGTSTESLNHKEVRHKEPPYPYLQEAMAAKRVEPVMRVTSSERMASSKSPEIAASPKAIDSRPTIPKRTSSQKDPVSERTLSLTRKTTFVKDAPEISTSNITLPAQSPQTGESPIIAPTHPIRRSLSLRQPDDEKSSTQPTSPTSPTKRKYSPLEQVPSPLHTSSLGESALPRGSHDSIPFLPEPPLISPLTEVSVIFAPEIRPQQANVGSDDSETTHGKPSLENQVGVADPHLVLDEQKPHSVNSAEQHHSHSHQITDTSIKVKTTPSPHKSSPEQGKMDGSDASEKTAGQRPSGRGSDNWKSDVPKEVDAGRSLITAAQKALKASQTQAPQDTTGKEAPPNLSHPLLKEARHAEFSPKPILPSAPKYPARDLPLRHYRSQDNFQSPGFSASRPIPKRSSSFAQGSLAKISREPTQPTSPSAITDLSPSAIQLSAAPSPLRLVPRSTNAPVVPSNLGLSRNLRSPELSPNLGQGATPPPINRGRVPLRVPSDAKSPIATPTSFKRPVPASVSVQPTTMPPPLSPKNAQLEPSTTTNGTMHLNPVSSSGLIEFLK